MERILSVMLKQLIKIPNKVCLAFSGGVDSLAVAHFLKRGRKNVTLLHFNHGCQYSDEIQRQCEEKADQLGLDIIVDYLGDEVPDKKQSLEDYWRRRRYRFLRNYANFVDQKVITSHHLNDAVETWLWSSLHGESKLIPYNDGTVIRPFIITEKQDFIDYANKNGLTAVDDPFNREEHLIRNYMRANMMEHVYYVNPGLNKVIRKKYIALENTNGS